LKVKMSSTTPYLGGTYLLEISRPFQPCIETTSMYQVPQSYKLPHVVNRGGITFTSRAITL
jgi:MOSC domain-containing protein YiiM